MTIPFQYSQQQIDLRIAPIGEHVRNAALAAAVTLTRPTTARRLTIVAETQNVRIRFDGNAATATTGFPLTAGVNYCLDIDPGVVSVSVIETAASAVINYQWMG